MSFLHIAWDRAFGSSVFNRVFCLYGCNTKKEKAAVGQRSSQKLLDKLKLAKKKNYIHNPETMFSVTWGETLPKVELPLLNPAQESVGASARHLAPGRAALIKETWARAILTHSCSAAARSHCLSPDPKKGLCSWELGCFFTNYIIWLNKSYYLSIQILCLFE